VAENLVEMIEREIGPIRGVVHAAGVLRDAYLLQKTEEEFRAVLRPKVAATLAIDQATRHCELRFMALFSSVAGAMGGPGQADYAAANSFLDGFAAQRNERVQRGQTRGVTARDQLASLARRRDADARGITALDGTKHGRDGARYYGRYSGAGVGACSRTPQVLVAAGDAARDSRAVAAGRVRHCRTCAGGQPGRKCDRGSGAGRIGARRLPAAENSSG